jgi:hypothetical protein
MVDPRVRASLRNMAGSLWGARDVRPEQWVADVRRKVQKVPPDIRSKVFQR